MCVCGWVCVCVYVLVWGSQVGIIVGVGLVVVRGSIPIGAGTMLLRCFPFSIIENDAFCGCQWNLVCCDKK